MAAHSSTLAWKIPWMEGLGGLQSMGSWLSDFIFTFHFHGLGKEMATHSTVLAWRIPGTAEHGGLPSRGLHRVGHDWSDLAAAGGDTGSRPSGSGQKIPAQINSRAVSMDGAHTAWRSRCLKVVAQREMESQEVSQGKTYLRSSPRMSPSTLAGF